MESESEESRAQQARNSTAEVLRQRDAPRRVMRREGRVNTYTVADCELYVAGLSFFHGCVVVCSRYCRDMRLRSDEFILFLGSAGGKNFSVEGRGLARSPQGLARQGYHLVARSAIMISFVQPASRSNAALLAVEEFTAAPAILMFRRKPIAMSFPPQPIEKEPMLPPLKPWLRRHLRTRWLRTAVVTFILWNVLDLVHTIYRLESAQAAANTSRTFEKQEKVYIAGMHWNNEIILRSHWNDALVALTRHFGAENVYVSIYESGSWDNSKDALRMLDAQLEQLGVRKTIILDETTHIDEISKPPEPTGWIDTPRGKRELRRIPYLAKIRNATLKPMEDLAAAGEIFDKVLFLNDVVFTVRACVSLLLGSLAQMLISTLIDPRYHEPVSNQWRRLCSRLLT